MAKLGCKSGGINPELRCLTLYVIHEMDSVQILPGFLELHQGAMFTCEKINSHFLCIYVAYLLLSCEKL